MLQAVVEAASWLLRIRDDFRHSVILLREAKGVKYGSFMEPGRRMALTVELVEEAAELATFKGKGEVDGVSNVSARFVLARSNLRDRNPAWRDMDARIIAQMRERYLFLCPNAPSVAPTNNAHV
jgi:3-hydroxyacyl-[acyl-carrier-protein] dehydratase